MTFSAPEEQVSIQSIRVISVAVVMLILVVAVAISYYHYARQNNLKVRSYLLHGVAGYLSLSLLVLYLFNFFYLEFEGSLRFYISHFNLVNTLLVFSILFLIGLFFIRIQACYQTLRNNVRISSVMTLFSFSGKINRKQFLTLGLFHLLALSGIIGILFIIKSQKQELLVRLAGSLLVFMLWPVLAIHVKRWRDRERSFWWFLLLPTIIGALWIIGETWLRKGVALDRR